MKISKIFHFLYFAVLSIPLMVIPIFAIYSQNHEINDNTLQVQENLKVDFNQTYYKVGSVLPYTFNMCGDVQAIYDSTKITLSGTMTANNNDVKGMSSNRNVLLANHVYLFRCNLPQNVNLQQNYYGSNGNQAGARITPTNDSVIFTNYVEADLTTYTILMYSSNFTFDSTYLYPQIFDLTIMDMENITIAEFNALFPNSYYEYTESQEMYIENAYTTTYDDTDIMSQFMYCEYNFMDKYLGIYKYQPFSGIYTWIQNTFFNANAPLVFTIFYQWFSYWLLVSLFWLIFDVLIYVPMVAHRWLDKGALE